MNSGHLHFEDILRATQHQLYDMLKTFFEEYIAVAEKEYLLISGEAPVLLVAHLDTVHDKAVETICYSKYGTILMSPEGIGGDDRCGVFSLLEIYEQSVVKPWLLFTCDEEIGGYGALAFCRGLAQGNIPEELSSIKMIIELDRKGSNDAVFYDCDNMDFESYIVEKGFKTSIGSFSDISYVAPDLGVAAVNLSCGYYNAHTLHEYINIDHMNNTIEKVVDIVAESLSDDVPHFEYIEAERTVWSWNDYKNSATNFDGTISLSDIPEEIRSEYIALLSYYTTEELEYFRYEMGDSSILLLYQSEFEGGEPL